MIQRAGRAANVACSGAVMLTGRLGPTAGRPLAENGGQRSTNVVIGRDAGAAEGDDDIDAFARQQLVERGSDAPAHSVAGHVAEGTVGDRHPRPRRPGAVAYPGRERTR